MGLRVKLMGCWVIKTPASVGNRGPRRRQIDVWRLRIHQLLMKSNQIWGELNSNYSSRKRRLQTPLLLKLVSVG